MKNIVNDRALKDDLPLIEKQVNYLAGLTQDCEDLKEQLLKRYSLLLNNAKVNGYTDEMINEGKGKVIYLNGYEKQLRKQLKKIIGMRDLTYSEVKDK